MSTFLVKSAVVYLREQFTRKEVFDVKPYGGQFSSAEMDFKGYSCPAIFVTALGWTPGASGTRLAGRTVRAVHMGAFIAFKHTSRDERMFGAMALAEGVCLALNLWKPSLADAPYTAAPLEVDPQAENLYGRAVDAKGQALWLVKWTQDVKPNATPQQLFDLNRIEITENYLPGVAPDPTAPGAPIVSVTDQINFQTP